MIPGQILMARLISQPDQISMKTILMICGAIKKRLPNHKNSNNNNLLFKPKIIPKAMVIITRLKKVKQYIQANNYQTFKS